MRVGRGGQRQTEREREGSPHRQTDKLSQLTKILYLFQSFICWRELCPRINSFKSFTKFIASFCFVQQWTNENRSLAALIQYSWNVLAAWFRIVFYVCTSMYSIWNHLFWWKILFTFACFWLHELRFILASCLMHFSGVYTSNKYALMQAFWICVHLTPAYCAMHVGDILVLWNEKYRWRWNRSLVRITKIFISPSHFVRRRRCDVALCSNENIIIIGALRCRRSRLPCERIVPVRFSYFSSHTSPIAISTVRDFVIFHFSRHHNEFDIFFVCSSVFVPPVVSFVVVVVVVANFVVFSRRARNSVSDLFVHTQSHFSPAANLIVYILTNTNTDTRSSRRSTSGREKYKFKILIWAQCCGDFAQ